MLRSRYDHEDALLLHEEVRALLELLDTGSFVNELDVEFGEPRYFAVSALGHQPIDTALASSGVSAFRVMDPIYWALDGCGILADPTQQQRPAPTPQPAAAAFHPPVPPVPAVPAFRPLAADAPPPTRRGRRLFGRGQD
jgi:hypothetical protein